MSNILRLGNPSLFLFAKHCIFAELIAYTQHIMNYRKLLRGYKMRIYTLESKGEVLAILTHKDNMSYRQFKEICQEAAEEAENDFYTLKDILVDENSFEIVEACGGYEVSKRKGAL